jgi:hypothetical protein
VRADFDRVYSPPEPPTSSRWPRLRALAVAVTAFGLAAGAVFFFAPMVGDSGKSASESPQPAPVQTAEPTVESTSEPTAEAPTAETPTTEPTAEPAPSPSGPGTGADAFETVPSTCSIVPETVFLKVVPKGEQQQYGGARGGSCGYQSPAGANFRYLRLETRVASTAQAIDPIGEARWAFGQDLQTQQKDTSATTRKLGPLTGLGEEAFQRFTVDKGDEKTVTARTESRVRNVIVTVSFSQGYEKDPDKLMDATLETAATVAKEALKKFS